MRLTPTKVSKWHARLATASKTIKNVETELDAHYTTLRGGDLAEVTACREAVRESRKQALYAEGRVALLLARENRKAAENGANHA